jgi:hypothetical protein
MKRLYIGRAIKRQQLGLIAAAMIESIIAGGIIFVIVVLMLRELAS